MPRFESDERFWEIERDGKRIRIRSGLLGEVGEETTHLSHFEAAAQRDFEERVATKLEQGFRPVHAVAEPVPEVDPALQAAILEALDPERLDSSEGVAALQAAWTVLGDWLAARGDVRGELVSIDETLSYVDGRGRDRLLARRDQLLAEWIPRWFGEYGKLDGLGHPISLGWDHGFIAVARIGTDPQRLDLARFRLGLRDLVPVLEQLLASPLMVPVRQLRIAELDPRSRRDLSARALPLLGTAERPALIRLELGGIARGEWIRDEFGTPRQRVVLARIGSLASLARAREWAPRLAALRVIGRELRVLPALPQLRVIEMMVPMITEELRIWLATSDWPRLERLWLRAIKFNDPWGQVEPGPSLDDLLDHLAASPLTELGLQGQTALATYLTHARVSAPLRELRLFCLGEAGVELLLGHHERLAAVERIVIEDGDIGPRFAELDRRFGGRVRRCQGTFSALDDGDGSDLRESIFDAPGWKAS